LRLYPGRFRAAFGVEMQEAFSLRLREVGSRHPKGPRRWLALAGFAVRTGLDGIRTAASERLRSSFTTARAGRGPERSVSPDPHRGGRGTAVVESTLRDIRFGLRALWKRPLFTSVTVLTLGLGIGCATSVFSVVDGVLLRPLPYADPASLVSIAEVRRPSADDPEASIPGNGLLFTWQDYLLLRDGVSLMDVGVFQGGGDRPLTGSGTPEQLSVGYASANLFELLGVGFQLGRGFLPGEDGDVPGQAAQVAVLSHELWQRRFGTDPGILGSAITLNGTPYTVVGVLPSGFRLQSEVVTMVVGGTDLGLREVWLPVGQAGTGLVCEGNAFELLGRLPADVSRAQAKAEADAILAASPGGEPRTARLVPR
ncbi:MAG TPA: ABC transporter permease, partial [Longimicrobiales bacterium]|nr:ABC transporter permease [Longimicrobiales bacterium]